MEQRVRGNCRTLSGTVGNKYQIQVRAINGSGLGPVSTTEVTISSTPDPTVTSSTTPTPDPDPVCDDGTPPPCDDTGDDDDDTGEDDDTGDDDDTGEDDGDDDDEPTTGPTAEACPNGKIREEDRCVCPSDTEEVGEMCLAPCTGGKERNANGACVCPSDTEDVGEMCLAPCTGGKERNANGQCVCPSGQEENDAGMCVVPTYGWSGVCYDATGTTGGGTGLSQGAATAAGQAFKAACPAGGVTTSVMGTTFWYATVTCSSGTSFTLGPFSTSGAADTAGGLGVSTCGLGRLRFNLPTDGPLTLAQVRTALAAALSELSAPLTLDDLTPPEIPAREAADPPGRAGGFSTRVASDGQYADVTCENGTTFTVGPAATLEAVLADGLLGLKVCANGEALAEMSLPESGTVTRGQLETAITAALAALPAPLTMEELASPPSGMNSSSSRSVQARNGSFSTWSSTNWSWTASCNAGGGSGAGSANTESGAANAIQLWVGSANCPAGGGTYRVFKE